MGRSISMDENNDTNVLKNKQYNRLRQKPKHKHKHKQ